MEEGAELKWGHLTFVALTPVPHPLKLTSKVAATFSFDKDFVLTPQSFIGQQKFDISTKPHNWVGLTAINVRVVKNIMQQRKNVVQIYIAVGI